jgi:hypothetical protein
MLLVRQHPHTPPITSLLILNSSHRKPSCSFCDACTASSLQDLIAMAAPDDWQVLRSISPDDEEQHARLLNESRFVKDNEDVFVCLSWKSGYITAAQRGHSLAP